jgi:hypothetical protein
MSTFSQYKTGLFSKIFVVSKFFYTSLPSDWSDTAKAAYYCSKVIHPLRSDGCNSNPLIFSSIFNCTFRSTGAKWITFWYMLFIILLSMILYFLCSIPEVINSYIALNGVYKVLPKVFHKQILSLNKLFFISLIQATVQNMYTAQFKSHLTLNA